MLDLKDKNFGTSSTGTPDKTVRNGFKRCRVVVMGNEKGGSGKSTTAMHLAIALRRLDYKVGTIDLDARQGTLTRYLSNRFSYVTKTHKDLPSPEHMAIDKSGREDNEQRRFEESSFLELALNELKQICDYIVVDTPGSDTFLNRLAHQKADALVTPMNDSLIDLDVLAHLDQESMEIKSPSFYTNMVLDLQSRRKRNGEPYIDWIVMRNRLSHLDARNKREVGQVLHKMSSEFGFRLAQGFGERVIFRELFLKGLTLMDLQDDKGISMTMSELAARQEVRNLVHVLDPEGLTVENS